MSFKQFSSAQDAPSKNTPDNKPTAAPTADQPATQPNKVSADVTPAPKS